MSAFSPVRRAEVARRAGYRCEYCRLPARGQVATFPIDHIVPRAAGGTNELDNLAMTCPHCNAMKWATEAAADPDTGQPSRLFNPRLDAWNDHFEWIEDHRLRGRTASGRTTVAVLKVNSDSMIELRNVLAGCGLLRFDREELE